MAWLDQYLDAWALHIAGDQSAMKLALEATAPNFRLTEQTCDAVGLPSLDGPEGVGQIFCGIEDLAQSKFDVVSKVVAADNSRWAIEFIWSGRRISNGREWSVRGACHGTLAEDGKVASVYEYWNPQIMEHQVGRLPDDLRVALDVLTTSAAD